MGGRTTNNHPDARDTDPSADSGNGGQRAPGGRPSLLDRHDRIFVLDIECSPDPLINQRGRTSGVKRELGLKLDGFCVLEATCRDDAIGEVVLHSFFSETEVEVLGRLEQTLTNRGDALLVTYNGLAFDLPVVRRRAIRHLLFDHHALNGRSPMPHFDLIYERSPRGSRAFASLAERCAVYSISCDPLYSAETPLMRLTRTERKCQVDVAATFFLFLHELASARGCADWLASGWDAFEVLVNARKGSTSHLMQFVS